MENNSPNEYRTGGHMPLQQPGGLLAVVIAILLAFTCMFLTAGFMVLRSDPLGENEVLASLYVPDCTTVPQGDLHMDGEVTTLDTVGITCQSISEFCEKYYELPAGIYILQVADGSPASRQGVLPGDVLVRVNGEALRLPATLRSILQDAAPNTLLELEFSRKGNSYTIHILSGV
jgi:membrane-associated protease RseP (regulator of RpoE activity)